MLSKIEFDQLSCAVSKMGGNWLCLKVDVIELLKKFTDLGDLSNGKTLTIQEIPYCRDTNIGEASDR